MILICFQEKLIYSNRFITVLISYCTSEQSVQEDREKKKNNVICDEGRREKKRGDRRWRGDKNKSNIKGKKRSKMKFNSLLESPWMCPPSTYGLSCYSCLSAWVWTVRAQDSAVIFTTLILAWLPKDENADWRLAHLQILFLGWNNYWSQAW